MNRLRPFWQYYGAKWTLAPRYPAPTHGLIVEPFAGSAAYSLLHHDRDVLLIDANPDVVDTWRYLLDAAPSEILDLPDVPASGVVAELELPRGPELLIRWWVNRAQSFPARRASSWMREWPEKHWSAKIRTRIAAALPRIRHWRVQIGDYTAAPDVAATWFVDPPYQGRAGKYYRHGSDALDYAALAVWCQRRQGQVMVCEGIGANWLPFRRFATTVTAATTGARKRAGEVLWTQCCEPTSGRQRLLDLEVEAFGVPS